MHANLTLIYSLHMYSVECQYARQLVQYSSVSMHANLTLIYLIVTVHMYSVECQYARQLDFNIYHMYRARQLDFNISYSQVHTYSVQYAR